MSARGNRMKALLLLMFLLICYAFPLAAQEDNCITCHQEMEDPDDGPSYKIVRDVHFQRGLSCVDCHGGDQSLEDMDEVREVNGYRGAPSYLEVPEFCGRCHSDESYMHDHNSSLPTGQVEHYKKSRHGQRLFGKGDTSVANCVSCHGVHDIADSKTPHSSTHPLNVSHTCGKCHSSADHMSESGLPTDQVEKYSQSVHGIALFQRNDLGAPTCNDCHGNHDVAPHGVSSVLAACGDCHAMEWELFQKSPHKKAFAENDFPMCVTCHSNHDIVKPVDALIGTVDSSLCSNCHESDDGTAGFETAIGISFALKRLVEAERDAQTTLDEAIEKGMRTTDEEFRQKEVRQALIQSRTSIHSFSLSTVQPLAEDGIAKARLVSANSEKLIDEYYFRRKGLGIATVFMTILVVALGAAIRRIERHQDL